MKHIKTFESFINESKINHPENESIVNESSDYVLKDDSGQGKPTWVLKLGPDAWKKVEHLFDKQGRPESEEIKKIEAGGARWDLYASDYTQDGKVMHKIYGASGDYTFGNAPTFYQQKYRGNKKAAKEAFDIFIDKFLK